MKVRFVTGNAGKAREAAQKLAPLDIEVERVDADLVEIQADTLEEVAGAKLEHLRGRVEPPYFIEDAGLFVDALNGFPGVYSAYVHKTIGNAGVLRLLDGARGRGATFRAVVAFADAEGRARLFPGEVRGAIADAERGTGGFGYDPIFVPDGENRTFAELTPDEKGRMSHRGRALDAFAAALRAT